MPIGEAPSTHIVKQSHIRLKRIVANEQLCSLTAKNLGIEIPQSFIIKTESSEAEDVLFATKRYDRRIQTNGRKLNGMNIPYRLHQEDFSQALGIPASEKYERDGGSYLRKMFGILRDYSSSPIEESFEKEATKAGLGVKMAMKRLDTLRKNFAGALNAGIQVLEEQGFEGTKDIAEQIMSCGGIRNYI